MDTRLVGANPKCKLSPLMAAKTAAKGETVCVCPYGCTLEDCDDNGYCDHLVGFTTDGKTMEPMVKDVKGRRVVDGAHPEPLAKGDEKMQITVSSRVYRKKPA